MILIFAFGVNNPVLINHWSRITHEKFEWPKKNNQNSKNQLFTKKITSKTKEILTQTPLLITFPKKKSNSCKAKIFKVKSKKNTLKHASSNRFRLNNSPFTELIKVRIAIMTTGEYAQYHIKKHHAELLPRNKQKEIVLNAIEYSLKEINKIFNRDLGIQLILTKNNDQLIFINPETDGLSNNNQRKLILEAPLKLKSLIHESNYDIAQTLGTFKGGISSRSVAFTNRKANGITGYPIPEGKLFNIDYLSHEIAHQLGATHTQNSNCSRDKQSAVEPGSGHTIMSYAGICNLPNSNISTTSKPYFHSKSIEQVHTYLKSKIDIGTNSLNILKPIPNYSIPLETPFEIKLNTTIPKNDFISFTCEQIDIAPTIFPPLSEAKNGPIFTSQPPNIHNIISFPKKDLVINNHNSSKYGVLATVPRNYSFIASARNTTPKQQGTSIQKFNVTVTDSPKFEAISQNTNNITWKTNSIQKITWNVGTTNSAPIHTKNVCILLSTDNGKTFQTLLKSTPNDGEATISVPSNIQSNECRIKIKSIDNIFYCLNKKMFSIGKDISIKKFTLNDLEDIKQKKLIQEIIHVDEDFNPQDLQIQLQLTHAKINDLIISIENPAKQKVTLWNQNCSNEQHIDLTFKDLEQIIPWGTSIHGGEVCDEIVSGYRNPFDSLKKLIGPTKGDWILTIKSTNTENAIILKKFNLQFEVNNASTSKVTQKISITPNPAFDKFTVELVDTNKNNENSIDFYTTSGNLIKTIKLSNRKIQSIPTENLLSGLYLLKIKNGKSSFNQKLIIK